MGDNHLIKYSKTIFITNLVDFTFSDVKTEHTPGERNEKSTEENNDESDCVGPFISEVCSESLVKEEREEIEMRMEEESLSQGKIVLCRYECVMIYIRINLCLWIVII